jgi:hypothetical protein
MTSKKTKSEPHHDVSRDTLETVPQRALTFLRAVGTSRSIRAALLSRGYSSDDHYEGWKYLHACAGFSEDASDMDDAEEPVVRDAIAELDGWDESGLRIVRATLERRFPDQAEFVLKGLKPATGAAAVLSVERLLERLDALESAPERKDSRKQDLAALEVLGKRGIDEAKRKRLRELVATAKSVTPIVQVDPKIAEQEEATRLEALSNLYAWYREWAEVARATIKRRDHLIRLGLASRRAPGEGKENEGDAEPVPAGQPSDS